MKIKVTDRQGQTHSIDAIEGWRVMEIIRDHAMNTPALAIKAECGGAMTCATCHVYTSERWQALLPAQADDEKNMLLDEAFNVTPLSRLSCQIMSESLDGLEVILAPGTEP